MAALIPSSLRTGSEPRALEKSWFTTIFPSHSKIAYRSILSIWVGYLVFAVVQVWIVQKLSIASFIAHHLILAAASAITSWLLYRAMHFLRGDDIFRLLVLLFTLPSLILAFILAQLDQWNGASPLFFPELFYGISTLVGGTNILVPYLLILAWGCVYLALTQYEEMEDALRNSRKLQKITRKSEQRALRYQLNPHFIFNALNSVSSLVVDNKNEQAERLVDELADYMRVVLDDEGHDMVTVANEIAQQVRYLEIEKVRFPHRLSYEINIAEGAANWKIPALIIQPLVENAIKHGVSRSVERVVIIVEAVIEQDRLKISVSNTGRMKVATAKGDGTGLLNIAERLSVIYGPEATLVTGNNNDGMAVATIIIPNDQLLMQALLR